MKIYATLVMLQCISSAFFSLAPVHFQCIFRLNKIGVLYLLPLLFVA